MKALVLVLLALVLVQVVHLKIVKRIVTDINLLPKEDREIFKKMYKMVEEAEKRDAIMLRQQEKEELPYKQQAAIRRRLEEARRQGGFPDDEYYQDYGDKRPPIQEDDTYRTQTAPQSLY